MENLIWLFGNKRIVSFVWYRDFYGKIDYYSLKIVVYLYFFVIIIYIIRYVMRFEGV